MGTIPAYFFPSTVASTSDVIDFGVFDNPFVGSASLCFGVALHPISNPPAGNDARWITKQAGTAAAQHELMLGFINTNAVRCRLSAGGSTATVVSANNLAPFNETHRWAITYDGVTIRLWKDGIEQTSGGFPAAKTGNLDAVASSDLQIGNGTGAALSIEGHIAECFIDRFWEPPRLLEWGRGEHLGNLLRAPFFWLNGDQWAPAGRSANKTVRNRAEGYVPRSGFVEVDVDSTLMPDVDRRDFIALPFVNFPPLDQEAGNVVTLAAVATGVATLDRRLSAFRVLTATATGAAVMAAGRLFNVTLAAVATVVATVSAVFSEAPEEPTTPFSGDAGIRLLGRSRWRSRLPKWKRRQPTKWRRRR